MLTAEQTKYMVIKFLLPSLLFNFLINGGIAYLAFAKLSFVPLWGVTSLGVDTLGTAFFLPFFTYLIVGAVVKADVKSGAIAPWPKPQQRWKLVETWPNAPLRAAVRISLGYLIVLGPLSVALMQLVGPQSYSFSDAVLVKALYATALTFPVIPIVVPLVLREQRHSLVRTSEPPSRPTSVNV